MSFGLLPSLYESLMKWEYRNESWSARDFGRTQRGTSTPEGQQETMAEWLNRLGAERWEAFHMMDASIIKDARGVRRQVFVTFKRQVLECS